MPERWADLPLLKIYSVARAATLLVVILSIVALNFTSPYNCQVGAMSGAYLVARAF